MMKGYYILYVLLLLSLFSAPSAHAQRLAVKSNLLADALVSPNIGAEILLSPQWTLDFSAHYQPFALRDDRRMKHWLLQPEARRWLCTPFAGQFLGAHLMAGRFNVGGVHLPFGLLPGARHSRYEGWLAGAGVSYGYHWVLSPHWGIEASFGVGGAFLRSARYRCEHCGSKERPTRSRGYFGPTKAAVSVVYMIR